jgi:hypothetical protein
MSLNLYNVSAMKIQTSGGDTTLAGITKASPDFRYTEPESFASSGSKHVKSSIIRKGAPIISLTTFDVAGLMAILTNTNTPMAALATAGARCFGVRNETASPDQSTTNHFQAAIASGQVFLDKIYWSYDSYVQADATVFGLSSDGSINPMVESTVASASLPILPDLEPLYDAVSLTVGGSAVDGVSSFEMTFDHKTKNDDSKCYTMGLPFPTRLTVAGADGPIVVRGSFETTDLSFSTDSTAKTVAFGFKPYAFGGTLGTQKTLSCLLALVSHGERSMQNGSEVTQRWSFVGTVDLSSMPWSYA